MSGMLQSRAATFIQELLKIADVSINGSRPWDIQIYDKRFFNRIVTQGSLGLGESFMDKWWDCHALDTFIYKVLDANLPMQIKPHNLNLTLQALFHLILNMQTPNLSRRVAKLHYNLDNEMYQLMLGPTMSYTCGYWKNAETLDEAQNNKHDLVCRKLGIQPGDKVLELGCGWGSFAQYAAKHYQCEVVSINISSEQISYAKQNSEGLPITFHLTDYRNIEAYNPHNILFDKVVSIGMCEHVGYKNYPQLMHVAAKNLKNHGLFLLHTIGGNEFTTHCEPWTEKYIFPGGVLPSIAGLGKAMENIFVMEDWHNFGAYYDKTLLAWHDNFIQHWPQVQSRYNDRFYRMWVYYLLSCAGMFRSRQGQLWQIVLSKNGVLGGYESVR